MRQDHARSTVLPTLIWWGIALIAVLSVLGSHLPRMSSAHLVPIITSDPSPPSLGALGLDLGCGFLDPPRSSLRPRELRRDPRLRPPRRLHAAVPRAAGIPRSAVPQWTGLLTAVSFVLGLPLAPIWGVWADRYSRKLVIIRSTIGEGVIFFLFGIAGGAVALVIARMFVGFILGNTGVMYAMLADVTPKRQLATAIAFISAGSTLGVSVGPFVGGWLVTWLGLSRLYQLDALACLLVVLLLAFGLHERRAAPRPTASTGELLRALPSALRASRWCCRSSASTSSHCSVPTCRAPSCRCSWPTCTRATACRWRSARSCCSPGSSPPSAARSLGGSAAGSAAGACWGCRWRSGGQHVRPDADRGLRVVSHLAGRSRRGPGRPQPAHRIGHRPGDARCSARLGAEPDALPGHLSFLVGGVGGSAIATLGIRAVFGASALVLVLAAALTGLVGRARWARVSQADG